MDAPGVLGADMPRQGYTGIHYHAALLFHEYSHVVQLRCFNACGANAGASRPARPFYNPTPLLAPTPGPSSGWSFGIFREGQDDAITIGTGWNHFWTSNTENPTIDVDLDQNNSNLCDHTGESDFCAGNDTICHYEPPGSSFGGSVCDDLSENPVLPGRRLLYFEAFAQDVEEAAGEEAIRDALRDLDWACPGKQMHEAAREPDDPEEDFPTAEDCYPSNGG